MALLEALIGPVASLIDKVIPNPAQRDKAKLELLQLQGSQELAEIQARLETLKEEQKEADKQKDKARTTKDKG